MSDPLVEAAQRLATQLLEPAAADVDLGGVPRSHLDALARAGLLGLAAPRAAGGAGADAAVQREVAECLAGADGATWFVQAQHHTPVRMLAANPGPAADRYLPRLATGELVAGIAFSHLRRFPTRAVTATRTPSGWRLDGVVPWYTGWGLNDVAFVAGVSEDDRVVFGVVPTGGGAAGGAGLSSLHKVRVAALDAAQTVALRLDGVEVADADVALVQPHEQWLAADRATSANTSPAVFGIGLSAIRLLAEASRKLAEPAGAAAAAAFAERFDAVRAEAYELADAPGEPPVAERLAVRAHALDLLVTVTSALVAVNAGAAMVLTSPAQRKAREALFLLVQAQTGAARAATLERWRHRAQC